MFRGWILLLFLASAAWCQPPDSVWSRTYGFAGDDFCFCADTALGGGFLLGGSYSIGLVEYTYFLRTDARGDTLWTRTLLPADYSRCYAIRQFSNANIAAAGVISDTVHPGLDAWLMILSPEGDSLHYRRFGSNRSDLFHDLLVLDDDDLLLVGERQNIQDQYEGWALRTDSVGNPLWQHEYPQGHNAGFYGGAIVNDGFAFAGYTYLTGDSAAQCWLVRVALNGDTLWTRRIGGEGEEIASAISTTMDGDFLIAGGREQPGGGGANGWVTKTDNMGQVEWSHAFGGLGWDWLNSIQPADGGWLLAGSTYLLETSDYDFWLLMIDENGDSLWSDSYGGRGDENGQAFCRTEFGYALTGYTNSYGAGGLDFYMIKFGNDPLTASDPFILHPSSFILSCYPNPFNSSTEITFDLPRAMNAQLRIFDITGRVITTLADGHFTAGAHTILFDASALSSGSYFARLSASGQSRTVKMQLLR